MANVHKVVKLVYNRAGQIELDQVNLACNYLTKQGVIAFPTDTLYGLAARADDSRALGRIYKIKGRDPQKPLAVCVSNIDQIEEVADVGELSRNVLKSLLPGPITVVLKRSAKLNKDLNPGIDTIGVRIPDHNFVMAVSHIVGPLALTSANRSGGKNPICVEDFMDLWNDVDSVFDSGPLRTAVIAEKQLPLGSTVVDLSDVQEKRKYTIIREGCALNRTLNTLHRFGYLRKK